MENQEDIKCPKCNSRKIHVGERGFSGGKAVAGALITGGVGALAGFAGSKKVRFTCLKCGNEFDMIDAKGPTAEQESAGCAMVLWGVIIIVIVIVIIRSC